jgi:competence protein ComEC
MNLKRLILLLFAALPLLLAAILPLAAAPAPAPRRSLDIYFIDVEGGAATLIVTPVGESMLIDSGWKRDDDRDATRIYDVARRAGLTRIDHVVTTHWHMDHYGGLGRLAEMLPLGHFYDHGVPPSLADDPQNFPTLIAAYRTASHNHSTTLRPGDTIPLRTDLSASGPDAIPPLTLRCLAASGKVISEGDTPPPPRCNHPLKPEDTSDNARSVVLLLSYGQFHFLAGGDLTWNIEHRLVCPVNRVGQVDLYQVDHHGLDSSNNPVFVEAIRPRVAVMCNGPHKGGHPTTVATLRRVRGLEAFYQLHRNVDTTLGENAPLERIANVNADCQGETIKVSVAPDARSYTVTVGSHGPTGRYRTR